MHQYKLLVSELEAVLPVSPLQRWADGGGSAGNGSAADALRALPAAVQNLHDYLIHVAARLERLHEAVDRAKDVFLAAMRQVGANSAVNQSLMHQADASDVGCTFRFGLSCLRLGLLSHSMLMEVTCIALALSRRSARSLAAARRVSPGCFRCLLCSITAQVMPL